MLSNTLPFAHFRRAQRRLLGLTHGGLRQSKQSIIMFHEHLYPGSGMWFWLVLMDSSDESGVSTMPYFRFKPNFSEITLKLFAEFRKVQLESGQFYPFPLDIQSHSCHASVGGRFS